MAFASVVRITSARRGRCFLVRDSARACEAHAAPIGVRFRLWELMPRWDVDPPSTRWPRDELWIVSQPTYNEKIS